MRSSRAASPRCQSSTGICSRKPGLWLGLIEGAIFPLPPILTERKSWRLCASFITAVVTGSFDRLCRVITIPLASGQDPTRSDAAIIHALIAPVKLDPPCVHHPLPNQTPPEQTQPSHLPTPQAQAHITSHYRLVGVVAHPLGASRILPRQSGTVLIAQL